MKRWVARGKPRQRRCGARLGSGRPAGFRRTDGRRPAALEQVDLLSQHDPTGLRAIGVLRGIVSAAA